MIRLVTLDFWQTLFADTADSLRRCRLSRLARGWVMHPAMKGTVRVK